MMSHQAFDGKAQQFQEAMGFHRAGHLAEAAKLYAALLARNPGDADATHLYGVLLLQQGDAPAALELIAKAARLRPMATDILANLAAAQAACAKYSDALATCEKILAVDKRNAAAMYGRGFALLNLRRYAEAEAAFKSVLAMQPQNLKALSDYGTTLAKLDRHDEALAVYDKVVAAAPDWPEAILNRGNALVQVNRLDDALASYDKVLAIAPGSIDAQANRGSTLKKLGRTDEAMAAYDRALKIDPAHVDALYNYGVALADLDRIDEALAYFDRALAANPKAVNVVIARGQALMHLGRYEESTASARQLFELDPSCKDVYEILLTDGCFSAGWKAYEGRWDDAQHEPPRQVGAPRWNGEHVDGVLLAWAEQGLGDEIIYASMIPDLARRARSVVVEVSPRLVDLFARSFPDIQVAAKPAGYQGPVAAHVPFGSMGQFLRPDWSAFPTPEAYLKPDPARVAKLRERFSDGRIVVGLSWSSVNPKVGSYKSAQLMEFAGLLRQPGFRFIDLQYGDTSADRAKVQSELGVTVERLADIDNKDDIDGLAALIAACDLVVTVSNTTTHLSGAIGQRTILLAPLVYGRMWYWFRDRADSPWYPNLEIRRKARGQSWSDLIEVIAADVAAAKFQKT